MNTNQYGPCEHVCEFQGLTEAQASRRPIAHEIYGNMSLPLVNHFISQTPITLVMNDTLHHMFEER